LRQPGEHTSGPNLASRDNVAHKPTLYTILETPPPVIAEAIDCAFVLARLSLPGGSIGPSGGEQPRFQLLHFEQIHVVYLASTLADVIAA
jgi:hypothetical protein